jgi:hypothetical protein
MDAPEPVKAYTRRFFLIRLTVTILAGVGLYIWGLLVSLPCSGVIAVLVWAYVAYGWWSMHPGPCVYCAQRGARPVLVTDWDPPWWDLRYARRQDMLWVCTDEDHYNVIVTMVAVDRIVTQLRAEQAHRDAS